MHSDAPPRHAATPAEGDRTWRASPTSPPSTSARARSPPCRRRSRELGIARPLLVSDHGIAASGLLGAWRGAPAGRHAGLPRHPAQPDRGCGRRRARSVWREGGCDGIVALGGGSPIDLAKGVALLATHDGPLEQYAAIYGGLGRITPAVAPVIAVPDDRRDRGRGRARRAPDPRRRPQARHARARTSSRSARSATPN